MAMKPAIAHRTHKIIGEEHIAIQSDLDQDRVETIVASMTESGWIGVPVITFRGLILTGNHRCVAADRVGLDIEAVDLMDVLAAENIDADEIADTIETYEETGDYSLAEELAGLIPAIDHGRLGIDFGRHN